MFGKKKIASDIHEYIVEFRVLTGDGGQTCKAYYHGTSPAEIRKKFEDEYKDFNQLHPGCAIDKIEKILMVCEGWA